MIQRSIFAAVSDSDVNCVVVEEIGVCWADNGCVSSSGCVCYDWETHTELAAYGDEVRSMRKTGDGASD